MVDLAHVAPDLLGDGPEAQADPKAVEPAPKKTVIAETADDGPGVDLIIHCNAEVYVRPVRVADGKAQKYDSIVAKTGVLKWNSRKSGWSDLKTAFAHTCVSKEGKQMGDLVLAADASKGKDTKFYIYICATPGYAKDCKVELSEANWDTVLGILTKYPTRKATITFAMANPAKAKENAAKAERTEKAAAQAARKLKKAKKKKDRADRVSDGDAKSGLDLATDSGSESGDSAHDPESVFMSRLFNRHPMNMEYDDLEPVVIDPEDPKKSFVLNHTAARTWAQSGNVDGVDELSPPRSLKYNRVKSSRGSSQALGAAPGGFDTQGVCTFVASIIAGLEAHRASQANIGNAPANAALSTSQSDRRCCTSESPGPCFSPPYTLDSSSRYGLHGFFVMCGWEEGKKLEELKVKFSGAGIVDFRLIDKEDLPLAKMVDLGINEMAARAMYKNVGKYARQLLRERKN